MLKIHRKCETLFEQIEYNSHRQIHLDPYWIKKYIYFLILRAALNFSEAKRLKRILITILNITDTFSLKITEHIKISNEIAISSK